MTIILPEICSDCSGTKICMTPWGLEYPCDKCNKMENKEIIHEIAENIRLVELEKYKSPWERDLHIVKSVLTLLAPFIPEWYLEKNTKPTFNLPVIVECAIYGRYIGWYQQIIGEFGNWHDGKQLGVLPPIKWAHIPSTTHPYEQLLKSLTNGK
jgi:hypothetical protein